jgi:hypothetical protein
VTVLHPAAIDRRRAVTPQLALALPVSAVHVTAWAALALVSAQRANQVIPSPCGAPVALWSWRALVASAALGVALYAIEHGRSPTLADLRQGPYQYDRETMILNDLMHRESFAHCKSRGSSSTGDFAADRRRTL